MSQSAHVTTGPNAGLRRRGALAALCSAGLLGLRDAHARDAQLAFDAESMDDAIRALGGVPAAASEITLTLPDVVDNGAVVPVTVSSTLPGVREIYLLVESNPNPVAAQFTFPAGTEPWVSTRIKMAQSGKTYAVVRTDAGLYAVMKQSQVTVGGCA